MEAISIDGINKMRKDIEAYKQSEQEATEIIAELKAYKDVNEDFKTAWEELKAENDRLKEEIETRDNLVEHFRKEAINWSKISNDCIKDIENYKQTLQEIKKYLNTLSGIDNDFVNTETYLRIIDLITKVEEE